MRLNLEIWWQRIIIVLIIALTISVAMFIIKEKPFATEGVKSTPHSEEEPHGHPPGTPPHED